MVTTASLAEIAALIGNPTRAAMLQALMDARALTALELSAVAHVTASTASEHLALLSGAGLITVVRQGRHRYHRLASPQVARVLESLMLVAAGAHTRRRTGPRDAAMRRARTCYDHIAGRLGVALADAMSAKGWVRLEEDAGEITPKGMTALAELGVAVAPTGLPGRVTPLCLICLDWSERRPHLAGRLGAALCRHGFDQGLIRRNPGTRALDVTPEGLRRYRIDFGFDLDAAGVE